MPALRAFHILTRLDPAKTLMITCRAHLKLTTLTKARSTSEQSRLVQSLDKLWQEGSFYH